jgi:DNA (cytosine-5)-methyltransferase 1
VSPEVAKAKGQTLRLTGQIIDLVAPGQLPGKTKREKLLPTTRASQGDARNSNVWYRKDRIMARNNLETAIAENVGVGPDGPTGQELDWAEFQPAISRWESILGRPAPSPTIFDAEKNKHRLNSVFTEWMMGLDEGWISSLNLSRREQLKACGNGVVPQQAVFALSVLLERLEK